MNTATDLSHSDALKYVYLFSQVDEVETKVGGDWEKVRALLGGKGAGLADMTRLGVSVCPGFTVTTEVCNLYLSGKGFPQEVWEQEVAAVGDVEEATGKKFGDPTTRCWFPVAQVPGSPCLE